MEAGARDTETVNAVFRAVHSIKGGAGAFALNDLVTFTHRFETVLDAIRSGALRPDPPVMQVLQRSADHLFTLVEAARTETPSDGAQTERLLTQLQSTLNAAPAAADEDFTFDAVPLDLDIAVSPTLDPRGVVITFRPHAALFANGHDPALLIAALSDVGRTEVEIDLTRLPDLDALDPATPYLGWTIRLWSAAPEAAVAEVFEFVDGLCELKITPLEDPPEIAPVAMPMPPEPDPAEAVATPAAIPAQGTTAAANQANAPQSTLRVTLERVDRLINAVGELIINQAMVSQSVQDTAAASDARLSSHIEDYRLLARDIQEAVMAIRAQPVKPLFQRMSRIVREASESTGKPVRLVTTGDSTEIDKTLIEQLSDPLTHMLRNAVDHGIETPDLRRAAGKDPCGTIRLAAAHRSGSVLITIGDDGAGLNRPKILEIARRKGLVNPTAELSDPEIDALLFLPGFSTSASVSNLSGRAWASTWSRMRSQRWAGGSGFRRQPAGHGIHPFPAADLGGDGRDADHGRGPDPGRPDQRDHRDDPPAARRPACRGPGGDVAAHPRPVHPDGRCGQLPGLPSARARNGHVAAHRGNREPEPVRADRRCGPPAASGRDQGPEPLSRAVPGVSAATVLGDGRIALILDTDALASTRGSQRFPRPPQPRLAEGARHAG